MGKLKGFFTKEFIKFTACSTIAACVNFGSRILFSLFTVYAAAIALSYCCGIVTAFTLNKLFVFKRVQKKAARQFVAFVLVSIFGMVQTLLISLLLYNVVFPKIGFNFHAEELAHLIGIAIPVFTSFLGHKYFSFS